ncbi:MAG: carbohydrate ABC transporter permease [Firmicutes bacterium]|nr:carbohydrate ABC transporter permease [Bacillota bacterium]
MANGVNITRIVREIIKYALVVIILVLIIAPFYWIFISSVKPTEELIRAKPTFIPEIFTLSHYQDLFAASDYIGYLLNSTYVALGTMMITVVLASLAAYSVYRCKYRGRDLILMSLLISYVFPGALLVVPLYRMMTSFHLVNSLASLVIVNVTFTAPFSVWLLRSFFRTIPQEIEEAATIDGAGRLRVLFSIFFPLAAPGIGTVAIYTFLTSWTEYLFANILIVDDLKKTLPVGLARFITQYNVDWGLLTAGAIATAVPPIIVFAMVGRNFIKGLTAGSLK